MLVLSRKVNEGVRITVPASTEPTVIECVYVELRGDKCRLGFTAPDEGPIHRFEVADRLEAEAQGSAQVAGAAPSRT
jgi:carbon storage regulator CsrA